MLILLGTYGGKLPSKILKRSAFLELDNGDKNKEDSSRLVSPHFTEYFALWLASAANSWWSESSGDIQDSVSRLGRQSILISIRGNLDIV